MGVLNHDWLEEQQDALVLPKTVTATLTNLEIIEANVIVAGHASTAVTLTLPAASYAMAGQDTIIANNAAQTLTVNVAAGFGGAGDSYDTITMIRGEYAKFLCSGTYWYALAALAPAAG